ncbi:MAG: hypothetical protein GY711_26645 [bacterium]|nr:hypothetical protein [bacterium]
MKTFIRTLLSAAAVAALLQALPVADARSDQDTSRPGSAPGTYAITPAADSIRIPFEVFKGEIRLIGRVNGKKARMLIDNGALWDQLLFFGSPKVDALEMKRDGLIQVGGAGSGDPIMADLAAGVSVSFDGEDGRTIDFEGQEAVIMPYEPGQPNPWDCTEGQVSSVLFKNFVVEFDFDAGIMTLCRPDAFDPEGKGTEVPIKPGPTSSWSIPATLTLHDGRRLELDMTMDLGWDDPLALNTGMEHGIELPEGLTKTVLGIGAQGPIHGYIGTVRSLEIGAFCFREPHATYSTVADGGAKVDETMVGLGIFERFHTIYDYQGHRMFLKPNRRFSDPFVVPEHKK